MWPHNSAMLERIKTSDYPNYQILGIMIKKLCSNFTFDFFQAKELSPTIPGPRQTG